MNLPPREASRDLTTSLRIRLFAANLPKQGRGLLNKQNPSAYAVVTSISTSDGYKVPSTDASFQRQGSFEGYRWGDTEIVNSRNPQWTRTIPLEYEYGSESYFYVHVLQSNCDGQAVHGHGSTKSLDSDAFSTSFGTALFEVSDVLGTRNTTKVKRLRSGGCVFCKIEPVQQGEAGMRVCLQVEARGLVISHGNRRAWTSNSFYRKPDALFEIAKQHASNSEGAYVTVYRSTPAVNTLDPVWDAIDLDCGTLCNGNIDQHLRFSVLLQKQKGNRELIGLAETTLRHLLQQNSSYIGDTECANGGDNDPVEKYKELILQRNSSKLKQVGCLRIGGYELIPESTNRSLSLREVGSVEGTVLEIVDLAELSPIGIPSSATRFQHYIERDCEIKFCVAIDFTSSNGDPRFESSLHYQSPQTFNDYEETISSIGRSLSAYIRTEEFAVWGFGAKFDGKISHLFQCGPDPTVKGVDGILEAYKSVIQGGLTMSGPTVFCKALQAAAVRAKRDHEIMTPQTLSYTVLLVITDGNGDSLDETRRKLLVYNQLPLSVIFVGVGRSDFGQMYSFLQESTRESMNSSFVEFRKHQYNPAALGRVALCQLPDDLCAYMRRRGF